MSYSRQGGRRTRCPFMSSIFFYAWADWLDRFLKCQEWKLCDRHQQSPFPIQLRLRSPYAIYGVRFWGSNVWASYKPQSVTLKSRFYRLVEEREVELPKKKQKSSSTSSWMNFLMKSGSISVLQQLAVVVLPCSLASSMTRGGKTCLFYSARSSSVCYKTLVCSYLAQHMDVLQG